MPDIQINDLCFRVRVDGPAHAPAIILSNSLGTSLEMWDQQVAAFTAKYRVIRYDARGHGASSVPAGPYSVEMLGRDALAILDVLSLDKVHWCGLSLGGMVGQWLGAHAPDRLDRVVLANTTCYYPDPSFWHQRIAAVREGGLEAIADRVIGGWLTADFRDRRPAIAERMKSMLLGTPAAGYIASCEALSVLDQRALLRQILSPTLVIAGRQDASTPLANAQFIADQISGARLTVLDAAHISSVEQDRAFSDAVLEFLN